MEPAEIERSLQTLFARALTRPFSRAVREFSLLSPSDHVAACISGGKDSMLLALLLRALQRTIPFRMTFLAMDPGYSAAHCGLRFSPCNCPAKALQSGTKRAQVKSLIAALAAENPQVEANLLSAVKNVDVTKLLGWREKDGERHSFLDAFVGT